MNGAVDMWPAGKKITGPWHDALLWTAAAGALPVWIALYFTARPALQLDWPLTHPAPFLLLVLLYPVLEEIVFRGLVQGAGHRYLPPRSFGPISLSNLVTTLAFVAVHFLYHAPAWAVAVLIPSLVFGYFKDKHGGLTIPIALHVYYNAGYYWIFGAGPQPV